jgi:hypothetical protein
MDSIKKPKSRIEKLEERLYSKSGQSDISRRSELKEKDCALKKEWQEDLNFSNQNTIIKTEKKNNIFSIFLIIATLFFLGALSYAGFIFYKGKNIVSANEVDIKILGPVSIGGGEKLDLDILIQNNNPVTLRTVDLVMEYPVGTKSAEDLITDLKRERIRIGDIPAGTSLRHSVSSVLFGEENSVMDIMVSVEYRIENSDTVFDKRKDYQVALTAAPIRLTVSGLEEISSGQELVLKYKLESNSSNTLNNVAVSVIYPFGFNFDKSSIEPEFENNFWLFKELKSKEIIEVEIRGVLTGENEEDRVFKFTSGLTREGDDNQIGAIFSSLFHDVLIKKSFVDLQILVNNNPNSTVAVNSGEIVNVNLNFTNNTNDFIDDLKIDLEFDGRVIDRQTIRVANGFYSSINDRITWSQEIDKTLARIEPRRSYNVSFVFNSSELFSGNNIFKNPEARFDVKITGVRVSQNNAEEKIDSNLVKNIKFITEVPTSFSSLYEEGPFQNSGTIPPTVEEKTTYTIKMSLSNSSNDLSDARVVGFLPSYVTWKNAISPNNANITFDQNTRQVVWNVGQIPAGTGYSENARTAYFQVEFLPSLAQLGQTPNLFNNIDLRATDSFANVTIERALGNITIKLGDRDENGHDVVKNK